MRSPPHNGIHIQEKLDIILTAAAFDQHIALLFLDDGVFQLKNNQQPERLGLKDTSLIFNALEIYDVNEIFTEVESLQDRGLTSGDLILSAKEFYRKDINGLMRQYDVVMFG